MTATVVEFMESRAGSGESLNLIYKVTGTDDDGAALAALLEEAPATHNGLARVDARCGVEAVWADEVTGEGVWTGTAVYAAPGSGKAKPRPQTGDRVLSFDTSGGTQHITQGLGTVWSHGEGEELAEDFQGAIGVTHDSVEGCEITVPTFKFSLTAYIADGDVTAEYVGRLFKLTGKVNDDEFSVLGLGTFDSGELLFLGSSGEKRGDGSDWEIQWHFAGSPNKTNLDVGPFTVDAKDGWDYLWVRYADKEGAKSLIKRPTAVYVEQVYDRGNFDDLEP